jgi:hypothetical protein
MQVFYGDFDALGFQFISLFLKLFYFLFVFLEGVFQECLLIERMSVDRSHSRFHSGVYGHHFHQLSIERYDRPEAQSNVEGVGGCGD